MDAVVTPALPRLEVLLAADAPVGLIFHCGPSKLVQVIGWDRERDTFVYGATSAGPIDLDRFELTPDGRHLLFAGANGIEWIPADVESIQLPAAARSGDREPAPRMPRRVRDGWIVTESGMERPIVKGWVLRQTQYGYQLAQPKHRGAGACLEWQWADWDRHRLVWIEGGVLWTVWQVARRELRGLMSIHDFSQMPE